ncbi:MAG: c-type cytochrome [Saprospiraceae bacterium]|nr:c-type cytochrome [Lewinella sp.]
MKKALKIIGIILGILVIAVGAFAAYIQSSGIPSYELNLPETYTVSMDSTSIANGGKLVKLICYDCHANPKTNTMEGKKMFDIPAAFGDVWSPNLTHPEKGLSRYTDEELVHLIRTGIKKDGKYAPPWMVKLPNMADEDLEDIIAFLRAGEDPILASSDVIQPAPQPSFLVKFLSHIAFKPYPYPEKEISLPDPNDQVAQGRYLANGVFGCFSCHSASFETTDEYTPVNSQGFYGGGTEMLDAAGQQIYSANITMDEATGIGTWTEADFIKAVKWGAGPKYPVRVPMPKFTTLTDEEVAAIFAYLKTVPVVKHEVDRTRPVN